MVFHKFLKMSQGLLASIVTIITVLGISGLYQFL